MNDLIVVVHVRSSMTIASVTSKLFGVLVDLIVFSGEKQKTRRKAVNMRYSDLSYVDRH